MACLLWLTTTAGAPVDRSSGGPVQTCLLLDSHLPLSFKQSYRLHCLKCRRLVYVISSSFIATESQHNSPSLSYHRVSISVYILAV